MSLPTLHSMPSSGNSYKVRLILSHLGLAYRHVALEYETPELDAALKAGRLPLGKLPVLVLADGTALPESNAILCYLAEGTDWLPGNPVERAKALGWMFWEQNQHEGVIAVRAALRTHPSRRHLATPERMAELLERGQQLPSRMNVHLDGREWFAGTRPSVADISLFAYTHAAEEKGGFDLSGLGHLWHWIERVAALPGHIALEDLPE